MDGENSFLKAAKSAVEAGKQRGQERHVENAAILKAKQEADAKRRKELADKFFGGFKARVESARNFVLGTPEIATGIGKAAAESVGRTADAAKESFDNAKTSVEAGWSRLVAHKDALQIRVDTKVDEIKSRAKVWGAENIATPVADRIKVAMDVPARYQEFRARLAAGKIENAVDLRAKIEEDASEKLQKLQAQMEQIRTKRDERVEALREVKADARAQAAEFKAKARDIRHDNKDIMKRIRGAVKAFATS